MTIAEALKPLGYATALFGKWHHGKPRAEQRKRYVHPMDQGFDEFFGYTDAVHAWEKFPAKLWDGRAAVAGLGLHRRPDHRPARRFVGRHKETAVLSCTLPYVATHFHIAAPDDEVARHKGKVARDRPDAAAQRDLCGDGHAARPQHRPPGRDARATRI